jgi:hypothetical protein
MWEYLITKFIMIYDIPLLIFSASGITYVVFLWFSFLLIGIRKLPGCAWTGIEKGLLNRDIHLCVDSVLNASFKCETRHGAERLWNFCKIIQD